MVVWSPRLATNGTGSGVYSIIGIHGSCCSMRETRTFRPIPSSIYPVGAMVCCISLERMQMRLDLVSPERTPSGFGTATV